jgi:hypothetical protein
MSDAMSFAEVGEQYVELLPARTVLSLLPAGGPGANGDPGTPGAHGNSVSSVTPWRIFDFSGSDSSHPYGVGDTADSAHASPS